MFWNRKPNPEHHEKLWKRIEEIERKLAMVGDEVLHFLDVQDALLKHLNLRYQYIAPPKKGHIEIFENEKGNPIQERKL